MTYNSQSWVKKQARMRADFRGLFSPGAAKTVGANTPWTPWIQLLLSTFVVLNLYLQRRCQTIKSFNQFGLAWFFRRQLHLRVSIHSSRSLTLYIFAINPYIFWTTHPTQSVQKWIAIVRKRTVPTACMCERLVMESDLLGWCFWKINFVRHERPSCR